MGRIPQTFIDELIARADIAEIIGARVPLKKSGREYKACCPFHGEKTPSFWVSPEKQFYHCFGCGAHGTVLGFLMNYDRLSFPEAIEDLAGRLGLEVPREGGDAGRASSASTTSAFELMGQRRALLHRSSSRGIDARRQYVQQARPHDGDHRALRHRLCAEFVERRAAALRRERRGARQQLARARASSSSATAARCAKASGTTTASAIA